MGTRRKCFQFAEEALDEVAVPLERLGEAPPRFAVGHGRDVRHRVCLDQRSEAVGIIGFVADEDAARGKAVEQRIGGLDVVRLAGAQREPERKALVRRRARGSWW